jgi:hypothetical protein
MNKTLLALGLSLAFAGAASATTITPVNLDPDGTTTDPTTGNPIPASGLNDPTPAAPVGGNPGTTVGEQRRIAYQLAADLWEVILDSSVEIKVDASFQALTCTANSAVLGSAGTRTVHAEFANAVPETWYGAALANSLAVSDLDTTRSDINSRFNANLGKPDCLSGSGWYYGLDGNTPTGKVSFLDTVMHEIGHGLNFQGFYNLTTGAPFSSSDGTNAFPDIYSRNVRDNGTGLAWTALTNAQRVAAAVSGKLVWTGATVTAEAPALLGPQVNLFLLLANRPVDFPMVTAVYGPVATTANFTTGQIVRARDPGASTSLGCSAFPAGAYTGKTVLMDRGTCSFKIKTLNAQNAGAAKVIIANNAVSGYPGMGDDTTVTGTVTIPSIGITMAAGNAIKKNLIFGVQGNLQVKAGQFAGTDTSGRVYLYAPNPFSQGSSFSHFDTSLTPNALMEPFINDSLNAAVELDLTPALFEDLGWKMIP